MGTSWNGQISHKEKDFRIQFQTDDYEKYKQVEKLCQKLMNGVITDDKADSVPYGWPDNALMNKEFLWQHIPDPCKSCSNHPINGGSGICNCTLGQAPVTCSTSNSESENYTFEVGV